MSRIASRLKWFALLVVVVLAIIVVFQNLAQTKVDILFFTVEMPHAALLMLTLLTGFMVGLSASALWKMRTWRARSTLAKKETSKVDTKL